ncbi:hypothetical protein [Clostridium tarantellae]|uniref:hypothetical protein n=1 Tax=Clostridium tarantellae TaxID=39493 RepID=UPI0014786235|nr:hypothetical protein [Clostridium tarantellae]
MEILENQTLETINAGTIVGEVYRETKEIYRDVRKNWDNMQDFANGFIDGIRGKY